MQEAGIDVRLGELGGKIQEVMESYEVTIGTKTYPGAVRHYLYQDIVQLTPSISSSEVY
jgi:hypothetical protein